MNEADLLRQFPVTAACTYLNHAAIAPWPQRTQEAVARFAAENAQTGPRQLPRWVANEKSLRRQLAQLINAPSAEDIAFAKNTSEALSFVAGGFPWQSGDNLVVPYEEFPSNRIVWESLSERGVGVRAVRLQDCADPEAALLAAMDARTRLLSVSTVQYATGLRLDLERLGGECRRRGVAFCVDAIQGLGVLAHDVQATQIDFLMADAHKWLLGPEGIAVFYCAADWRERIRLSEYGWHMVEDSDNYDHREWRVARGARRFECGSLNRLGIEGLAASLSLLLEVGLPAIEQRVLERAQYLLRAINARPRFELLTPSERARHGGIVTFRTDPVSPLVLWKYLAEHNVVCAVRGGGIRLSPHFYVPMEQLDEAVRRLDQFGNPKRTMRI